MIYALLGFCTLFVLYTVLAGVRAYNHERVGKPDFRKIERLEVELGIAEPQPSSINQAIKEVWEVGPGEVIGFDGVRPQWTPRIVVPSADEVMSVYVKDCHFGS